MNNYTLRTWAITIDLSKNIIHICAIKLFLLYYTPMKAGFLLIKFLKIITIILFLVLLFIGYFYLPPNVAIHYTEAGQPDGYIDKPTFFYASGIFVVIFFTAVSLLARIIFSIPAKLFPMPNRNYWLTDQDTSNEFSEIVRDWLNSLTIIVNILASLCIYALLKINTAETAVADFRWILTAGILFLLGWILFLPLRLLIKKNSLIE